MNKSEQKLAELLLQIKAIKLSPASPFTWASGWKSPIYCDNRQTLSFPDVRDFLRVEFAAAVKEKYPNVEVIAGVATGAIAIGALVADELNLPFVYVRPKAKEHGMGNQVEGYLEKGKKVVVIEDLISTGGSSLNAVKALRAAEADVMGMLAIFTYQFSVAENNFKEANVTLDTLGNYTALIDHAGATGYVSAEDIETLKAWRQDPSVWGV